MRIWILTRHGDKGISPYPYAVTKSKKLKNKFLEQRDSSHFRVDKMDISSLTDLPVEYKDLFLIESELLSKDGKVKLVLTGKEDMTCIVQADDLVYAEFGKYLKEPLDLFKEDIRLSLQRLWYHPSYSNYYSVDDYNSFMSALRNELSYKISDDFKVDQLSVFIKLYGWTMKK